MPDEEQQPARPPAPDPYEGMGGSYVIENGVRRLVERTRTPDLHDTAADAGNEGS